MIARNILEQKSKLAPPLPSSNSTSKIPLSYFWHRLFSCKIISTINWIKWNKINSEIFKKLNLSLILFTRSHCIFFFFASSVQFPIKSYQIQSRYSILMVQLFWNSVFFSPSQWTLLTTCIELSFNVSYIELMYFKSFISKTGAIRP